MSTSSSPSHALASLRSPSNASTSSELQFDADDLEKHKNLIHSSLTQMFKPLYQKENMMELVATSSSDNIKSGIQTYPFYYGEGYDLTPAPVTHRIAIDPHLFPTGKDHGRGSKQLISTYLEHVLDSSQPTRQQHVQLSRLTKEFKALSFDEQLQHVELRNVPYASSIAIQKGLLPSHSTDAKQFFHMITTKLRENDATLVRLRLSNMAISDFILQQLCKGICRNSFLQYLILHNNAITDHGIESLCTALRWHPSCHSIWLGGNKVTDVGLRHLALLCHRNAKITEINLANKWPSEIYSPNELSLHPHITYVGAQYLCNQLKKECSQLTSISLAHQRIRDQGAILLYEILSHTTLRTLNLTANELTSASCGALQEALRHNPVLEELVLAKNTLADEGVVEVATGLAFNSNLSTLDISYNNIHVKGLYALYQCLQYNTTLTSLITVGNHATDERAENLVANRSRSIFVFPSNVQGASFAANSPMAGAGGRKKSMIPNTMKELRASLSMNPVEELKRGEEEEAAGRGSPMQSPTRKTRRSYGSFAEFAQSPFKSSTRQASIKFFPEDDQDVAASPVANATTLASSNGIETLGRKQRHKSVLGAMEMLLEDDMSIKEGEAHEEQEDDDSMQRRVQEKLHSASKKKRGGPLNIQDAIATAVGIVEEIEREEVERSHTSEAVRRPLVNLTVDTSSPSTIRRKALANKAKQDSLLKKVHSDHSLVSDKGGANSPVQPDSPSLKRQKSMKKKKVRLQGAAESDSDAESVGSSIAGGDEDDNSVGSQRSEKAGKTLTHLMKERKQRLTPKSAAGTPKAAALGTPKAGIAAITPKAAAAKVNPFELSAEERQKFFDQNVPVFNNKQLQLKNRRLSQDYGKTLGVPKIKSMGIRPIRTSISAYADSGQHLMYLRVATEDDPVDARPTSFIKIGLDKRAERERIRQSRQTQAYKLAKMERMTQKPKEKPQQAAVSRVPEKFWRNWRMKMQDVYPDGIDEASNCKSTKLEPIAIPPPPSAAQQLEGVEDPYSMYDRSDPNGPWNRYLASKSDEKLAYQKHLGFKARYFPPGDVLAARRKENELKKHRELLALQNPASPTAAKKKIGYNVTAGKQAEKKKKVKYDSDDSENEEEDEEDHKHSTKLKEVKFNNSRPSTGNNAHNSDSDVPREVFLASPLPSKPNTPLLSPPSVPQPQHNKTISFADEKPTNRLHPLQKTSSMGRNKTSPSTFVLKNNYAIKKNELIKTR